MTQTMLDGNTKFQISDNVFPSQMEQEKVVLSLKLGQYYGLDELGSRIWDLVQQSHSLSEISNTICLEYEVEIEECDHDVRELLEELLEAKLIEVSGA